MILKVCMPFVYYPLYSFILSIDYVHIYIKVAVKTIVTNGFGLHTSTLFSSVLEKSDTNIQGASKEYDHDL